MNRVAGLLAITLLIVGGVSACSPAPAPSDTPYAAEFEQARAEATSDFERDVLSDSKIDRQEYDEAVQRYIDCLNSSGLSAVAEPQDGGLYQYAITYPDGADPIAASAETDCLVGTKNIIEPLYATTIQNPGNEDPVKVLLACLVRHGVVDSSYSIADLKKELRESPIFREGDEDAAKCLGDPSS